MNELFCQILSRPVSVRRKSKGVGVETRRVDAVVVRSLFCADLCATPAVVAWTVTVTPTETVTPDLAPQSVQPIDNLPLGIAKTHVCFPTRPCLCDTNVVVLVTSSPISCISPNTVSSQLRYRTHQSLAITSGWCRRGPAPLSAQQAWKAFC